MKVKTPARIGLSQSWNFDINRSKIRRETLKAATARQCVCGLFNFLVVMLFPSRWRSLLRSIAVGTRNLRPQRRIHTSRLRAYVPLCVALGIKGAQVRKVIHQAQ